MDSINQELVKRLNSADVKKVKRFSFKGYQTLAKIVSVYDADTVTVIFEYNETMIKVNIRIDGVDAPEMKSKDPLEQELAKKGQLFVSDLILNTVVKLNCKEFDKYGRILGDIIILEPINSIELKETKLSELLIEGGYVRKYDGGHKDEWNL